MKAYDRTTHDGKTVDWLTKAALMECERRLGYPLTIVQGSYHRGVSASAGTHDGGGVVDLAPWDWENKVRVLRAVGFAVWHRPTLPGVWGEHIHAVLIGNSKLAPSAARQVTAYRAGRDGLARNLPDNTWRPKPIPTFTWAKYQRAQAAAFKAAKKKAAAQRVKFVGDLVIGHGNLFKDNAHKPEDVALLDKQTAHVFGLNEAYRFRDLLKTLKNYRVIQPAGSAANNAILLRHDVTRIGGAEIPGENSLGEGSRKMCDKVGTSPQRDATWVKFEHLGRKRAHIQTHTNAHIEDAGKPRNLPRVAQDIRHLANLSALVKELRAQGYRVTVAGDFNWAYRVGKVWANAPRVVFWRLGMYVNWANPTAPAGGSLGSRRIDYLAHSAADLRIVSQRYIAGEHSDHRWPEVTYRVVA